MTAAIEGAERRWLGAVALEGALGRSALLRIAAEPVEGALDAFLERGRASGLLRTPPRPPMTSLAPVSREPEVALESATAQRTLRALAARGDLAELGAATRAVLGARSSSDVAVALHSGDLGAFDRVANATRAVASSVAPRPEEALRRAVVEAFDPAWLRRTWGSEADRVMLRVLRDALDGPEACEPLHAYVVAHPLEEVRLTVERAAVLCEHALFRGDADQIEALSAPLPLATALGYRAAARFALGDRAGADALLDDAFGGATHGARTGARVTAARGAPKRSDVPRCGAVGPLLALLLRARDEPNATVASRRCLAGGRSDGERGAAKSFRTLLTYLEQAPSQHRRLHLHQLGPSAPAWEVLLTALTVHLHFERGSSRGGWAQHLAEAALRWRGAGYGWLGAQAAALGLGLSATHASEVLASSEAGASLVREAAASGLWGLLGRTPEWKKTLQALAQVSSSVGDEPELGHRVSWYLDMTDGSFRRPALAEYRSAKGWSQGRRVTLGELTEHQATLPPEDLAVLRCSREGTTGERELTPDAYERMIGHPRVFDGRRGPTPIDVVRGTCRVETEQDGDFVRVAVVPRGAALGINVSPEGDRLVVYRVTRAMQRVLDVLPDGVRVPRAHEPEVLRVLEELAQRVEVRGPHLGVEREVVADATPCLRLAPQSGGWSVQLGVRPFAASGRFFVAGLGRAAVTSQHEGQRLRCERDLELERARVDDVIARCPTLQRDADAAADALRADDPEDSWFFGEATVLSLLAELRDAGSPCTLEWPESPAIRLRGHVTARSFRGRLRCEKGWYLATGGVRLDDLTEVTLRDLVRAPALASGRFVRLPTGDYVEVERRVRRVVAALALGAARDERGGVALHPGAIATLRALTSVDGAFAPEPDVEAWLTRAQDTSRHEAPLPEGLRAELRPYQREGYQWLRRLGELGLGACLADDMGLGKTVQILALLLARAAEGPALVVAPTSVCANWAREVARFAPSLRVIELARVDRAAVLAGDLPAGTVVLASYAVLQQDATALAAITWGTAVLDEAQFIKNPDALRARAAFRLTARMRVVSTGTPVENHPGDLWSLFHFLNPGLLGDAASFHRRFARPIERDGDALAQLVLRELTKPMVLRRLKRDVLPDLPPLTDVLHEVHLTRDESLRYALLRRQVHERIFEPQGKGGKNQVEVLAELTRLRRFCCHPKLVFPDAALESSKIETLLELVAELRDNGHRALVFSQWVDFLALVRAELDERGVTYEYLDGSTPTAQRQARVDAFQEGQADLFLISLKAGGFGLNLTAADYVIHLDPWWNPAVLAQATDRAHRIGQDRPVTVYRLVTKDTIEEKIVELHAKKEALARTLVEGGDASTPLDREELLRLLREGVEGEAG